MSSRPLPEDPLPATPSTALDRLLLGAPLVEPDAWFAARTLARCRNSEPKPSFFSARTRFWPRWALGGALGLFLCAFALQQVHHSETVHINKQRNVQEAFEIVASLDSEYDMPSSTPDATF